MSELRKDSLSFAEALGQSIANVSPTLTPAVAVVVVVGMAGTGSWLVYVLATIALVVVGGMTLAPAPEVAVLTSATKSSVL